MAITTNKGHELDRADIEKAVEQVLAALDGFPLLSCMGVLEEAESMLKFHCFYQHSTYPLTQKTQDL